MKFGEICLHPFFSIFVEKAIKYDSLDNMLTAVRWEFLVFAQTLCDLSL